MVMEVVPTAGSSPRVRGKGRGRRASSAAGGIIPAGAGKSVRRSAPKWTRWDHPRGCGEKLCPSLAASLRGGSSPRVRGKAPPGQCPQRSRGIIPAGAGKRHLGSNLANEHEDHPRGCGEKIGFDGADYSFVGSSPRVRGKVAGLAAKGVVTRIIPAGAGKSWRFRRHTSSRGDHPRGCGEKISPATPSTSPMGSSPRVRGKDPVASGAKGGVGIIPAGAGKSPL